MGLRANIAARKAAQRSAGFTLIELLIVVAIVGLISATAIPVFDGALRKSRRAALRADSGTLYRALMTYEFDYNKFPSEAEFDLATLDPLHSGGYFAAAASFTNKLQGSRVLIYLAPDIDGQDTQFLIVTRAAFDPREIFVVAYTDIIAATEGWIDGVYLIDDGDLEEAEEIEES